MTTHAVLAGRRILLVEDEYFIAEEMLRAFEDSGAEIIGPAPTVEDALRLLAATAMLDGAVIDINLRGEMGYPVADAFMARGVPFLFTTGYDARHIPPRYAHIKHCEKPIEPARIAKVLFGKGDAAA
jgi:CheY-like chemotaxis protein